MESGRALVINKVFGPTFQLQGEGPSAGRHCMFVRLWGCNLECRWCDTPYTWATSATKAARHIDGVQYDRDKEAQHMTIDQVIAELQELWPIRSKPLPVVASGGEPLIQQLGLTLLMEALDRLDCPVHIETAGTIMPTSQISELVARFIVSPKLGNSGNIRNKRYKEPVLRAFANHPRAWFKFVVGHPSEVEEVDWMVNAVGIRRERVMLMPEGISSSTILESAKKLSEVALERGYGLSMRNHILLWENKRDV